MKNNKKSFFDSPLRWARFHGNKLKRIRDTPHSIAIGVAIGVFWGVFPTPFIGVLLALGCASIFKVNRTASIIGTMIMNPITTPFFWTLSAYLGGLLTNTDWHIILNTVKKTDWKAILQSVISDFKIPDQIADTMGAVLWSYMLGNIIVSVLVSYLIYLIVLGVVKNYQGKKAKHYATKKNQKN